MKTPKFCLETYTFPSKKIIPGSRPVRFCFLSDLHGTEFAGENRSLLRAIASFKPDGILVGGDMIVGKLHNGQGMRVSLELLQRLAENYPVWYALGNHEHRMMTNTEFYGSRYMDYERELVSCGVRMLHNESETFDVEGTSFRIYGLELEQSFYKKPLSPRLTAEHITELLQGERGDTKREFESLLAHNPKYGQAYFDWGADLILSGHYHGGLMRFSRRHGLISPQFWPFPRYCCGDFIRGDQRMLVSAGLGEHTLPFRIHNPRVLLEVTLCAAD